ncbi:hypothetical protein EEAAV_26885 (plasmid) [Rahnella aceris]
MEQDERCKVIGLTQTEVDDFLTDTKHEINSSVVSPVLAMANFFVPKTRNSLKRHRLNDITVSKYPPKQLQCYAFAFAPYLEGSYIEPAQIINRYVKCVRFMNANDFSEFNEQSLYLDEKVAIDDVKHALRQEIASLEEYLSNLDEVTLKSFSANEISREDFILLPGRLLGIIGSAMNYEENVIMTASRGHGFAAEKANHLYDLFTGKDAKIVGGDFAKNGADRVVNGINIQTKYCASGSKCISECFKDSTFRYVNADGTPMQIEVPSDLYESAVQAMRSRIERGEVPGVSNPDDANKIVRKGNITYTQARNIAKFGTIESLTYDAASGVKLAGYSAGLSSLITFASCMWSGDSWKNSLEASCYAGLKVGGTAFISSIMSAQAGRTGIEQSLRGATDWAVRVIGSKGCAIIANSLRSGKDIYGVAAANYVSKLLRGNIVTGVITTTVISSVDFYKLARGKISGAQTLKNVTITASSVAGGTGGWLAGVAAGAAVGSIFPVVGTGIGGVVGGILGSVGGCAAAAKLSKISLDMMIKDDADKMLDIFKLQFSEAANDYLLNQSEAEAIIEEFKKSVDTKFLQTMFASTDHARFAYEWVELRAQRKLSERAPIKLNEMPSQEDIILGTQDIVIKVLEAQANELDKVYSLVYEGEIELEFKKDNIGSYAPEGLILPANINVPFCQTSKLSLFVPFDCVVVESLIKDRISVIRPGDVLLKVRKVA